MHLCYQMQDACSKFGQTWQNYLTKTEGDNMQSGSRSCSVAGGALLGCCLLFALLLGAAVEASIHKALWGLTLEVLPGAHQGGVVDQCVHELPVAPGSLGTGHLVLFLLLLDQLDPWGRADIMMAPKASHIHAHEMITAIVKDSFIGHQGPDTTERVIIESNHILIL